MTAAQILEQRGFDKGKAEGEIKGEAKVLGRQLDRKFGPLPQQYAERLVKASATDLELWTDRILFADSLDAVFTENT